MNFKVVKILRDDLVDEYREWLIECSKHEISSNFNPYNYLYDLVEDALAREEIMVTDEISAHASKSGKTEAFRIYLR